ncbi:MBL fold metallo-hydrolase [Pseudalkalibacillus hwajinpoensis]|uniref:MBL fold metallo-hydrolase n=1 Tax=Guptibacillus hwajinpoensis TaxID=208199 RepID=UPI001CFC6C5D
MNAFPIETPYFTFSRIDNGVYVAIAKEGKGAWSNAGVVDLGEELLVFDSFSTPSAARELRVLAERLTGKKTRYLINSHYHGDHVFGNQVFEDIAIISTNATRELSETHHVIGELEAEQEETRQYLRELKKQMNVAQTRALQISLSNQYDEMTKVLTSLPELKIVLPSIIFEKKLTLYGSDRKVELMCWGGGHTASDTFLYLPDEKIAFMGDLATEDLHVPIYNPDRFVSILNEVMALEINTVIPGHGNISGRSLLETQKSYVSYLIGETKKALKEEIKLDDFKFHFQLFPHYQNWKGIKGVEGNLSGLYHYYNDLERCFHD